ncbi:polysaccharide pyruvyl transferase family protein [Altibacter sp.]|uniref:polysaccharide pyruvyl transferase family protein n=1 Tax=Altibacter sp. TaxID=2024823 RepID=UPI00258CB002|nr:polysaccharide pyruvyl transferase family protein [Altibacter sp.]MCW9036439.1 polysaccharide pyruvyl transferase family protein [Altibacter sp.]
MKQKKALVINEGYSDNLGDQAIRAAMLALLTDHDFDTEFLYLSKPSIQTLPSYSYTKALPKNAKRNSFMSQIKGILYIQYWYIKHKKHIRSILQKNTFDIILIGGGQLINSAGTIAPSGFAVAISALSRAIKKHTTAPIYLTGVGFSGNYSRLERALYQKGIKRMDGIYVRDTFSQSICKAVFKRDSVVIPDIAFYASEKETSPKKIKEDVVLLGITNFTEVFKKYNTEASFSKEDYFEMLYKVLLDYRSRSLEVLLFYTTLTDAAECRAFQAFIKGKYNVQISIASIASLKDLLHFFTKASHVYSARMHALILGMKKGCEVQPYLISQKLHSFNEAYVKSPEPVSAYGEKIVTQLKPILG